MDAVVLVVRRAGPASRIEDPGSAAAIDFILQTTGAADIVAAALQSFGVRFDAARWCWDGSDGRR